MTSALEQEEANIQTLPDNPETQRTSLKEEWFKAYTEGNGLVPQEGIGILSFVAATVELEELEDFFRSEFSDDQLKQVGLMMTNMHVHHGIDYAFGEKTVEDGYEVKPERLDALWRLARTGVLNDMHNFMHLRMNPGKRYRNIPELDLEDAAIVINFFRRNPEEFSLFTKIHQTAVSVLTTSESKGMLREYKTRLGKRYSEKKESRGEPDILGSAKDPVVTKLGRQITEAVVAECAVPAALVEEMFY